MNHTLKWIVGVSVVAASLVGAGASAIAQEEVIIYDVDGVTQPRPPVDATIFPYVNETLSERAVDTFYTNDQNYYDNRSVGRQILWFFGLSHTDNEVKDDGREVSQLIQDLWHEQASSSATVRTRDLPNPFQSSLLLDPTIPVQEFSPTSIRQPIPAPPAIATPRVVEPGPVRALW